MFLLDEGRRGNRHHRQENRGLISAEVLYSVFIVGRECHKDRWKSGIVAYRHQFRRRSFTRRSRERNFGAADVDVTHDSSTHFCDLGRRGCLAASFSSFKKSGSFCHFAKSSKDVGYCFKYAATNLVFVCRWYWSMMTCVRRHVVAVAPVN